MRSAAERREVAAVEVGVAAQDAVGKPAEVDNCTWALVARKLTVEPVVGDAGKLAKRIQG